jgi:phage shock protein A
MFSRIGRIIKSFFNRFLGAVEDPVLILENNIREMKNQIPKLNEAVAKAAGTVILLEKQLENAKAEEKNLRAKLQVAANAGEDKLGKEIALQLQRTINQREKLEVDLKSAKEGLNSMKELRDSQVLRIKRETEKIKDTIEDSKVAKLKGELAELFETYSVDDVAFSNQEMLEKLQEESAMAEGKFQTASEGPKMQEIKLEKKAEEIEAESLYAQFKQELGIDVASSSKDSAQKKEEKAVQKTIG